tara:strand:+ start:1312 stop:1545 length:234 start_codon:yes stop_codon:yes gene_type:complete
LFISKHISLKCPFFDGCIKAEYKSSNKQGEALMSNIKPKDNSANMTNRNKGTSGTNKQYDQAMGHRGKQIQQNRGKK